MRAITYDIRKDDLQRMFDAGMQRKAMAAVYGCSSSHMSKKLKEFGIETALPRPDIDAAITAWQASFHGEKE